MLRTRGAPRALLSAAERSAQRPRCPPLRMRWAQQPPRRGLALPAIPIAIKAVMVMGKYLRPIGWAARPAAMYAARWWPYYMVKFTVIKQIEA